MGMPVEKVEVGFDQSFSANPDFFTLDDATKGQLNNTSYPLAGLQFIDITSRVKSFTISRGRSSILSSFPAGQVSIELNNHDRAFDPLFSGSPYAGNILPRRQLRVTSGTAVQFSGWIEDWNLSYTPNGDSVADAVAYDAIGILSGQTLSLGTPTAQLTGARINNILDQINWSGELRDIDPGIANLSTYPIDANSNAMSYLQKIGSSEPGLVFVDKEGKFTFRDRATAVTSASLIAFGGTGIPFQNLEVVYGSESLYNEIVLSRAGGGTATAQDPQSISDYGLRNYSETDLLLATDLDLLDLALVYAQRYSQPEYRFQGLEVPVHKLDSADQNIVLNAELGAIAQVTFTPNGIGDPIVRFVQIISIAHSVTPETHFIEFGFQAVDFASLILDDAEFGKLDTYSLSW